MNDNQSRDDVDSLPVMAVVGIESWGVSPDGQRALAVVQTATQRIRMALDFETLSNMVLTLKSAMHQAQKNALASGGENLAQAIPVNGYSVGHTSDVKGVLLVIDHEMPSEAIYVMPASSSVDMGKKLMAEGQRQANIARQLDGAVKGVVQPTKPKLILPRDVH
jgi:hypothetical protein